MQHRLRTHSAAAAAATRRQLNRVTGGGIGASDTPPPPTHGQNRDLGSGPAAQSSRHAHTTVRGTSTSNDAGAAAAAAGPRSSSGSSRGVPLLQRYPDVSLPGRVHRIQPGLSALAPAGEGAADYLEPLLQFARQQVGEGCDGAGRGGAGRSGGRGGARTGGAWRGGGCAECRAREGLGCRDKTARNTGAILVPLFELRGAGM